jgi:hypothetical protein
VVLHEAGHCCVSLALGGNCTGLAIFEDGHGVASLGGLSPFDNAIALAAGAVAEELVVSHDPASPDPFLRPAPTRNENCDMAMPAALADLAACFPLAEATPDAVKIAQYCIGGLEDEPERWAPRFYVVHAVAQRVVSDHREKILSVARALFARGVLHKHEIQEELKQ